MSQEALSKESEERRKAIDNEYIAEIMQRLIDYNFTSDQLRMFIADPENGENKLGLIAANTLLNTRDKTTDILHQVQKRAA